MEIYIGNLPEDIWETPIKKLFKKCGPVQRVILARDKVTEECRGFGFVKMKRSEDALKALNELNGTMLGDNCIVVRTLKPRKKKEKPTVESDFKRPIKIRFAEENPEITEPNNTIFTNFQTSNIENGLIRIKFNSK